MPTIALKKQSLRKIFKEKRSNLSNLEVKEKSRSINENFIQNLLPKIYQKNSGKIFSLYFPSFNEVETADIADYFQKNDISFSYPKIIKQDRYLDFIKSKKDQKFIANHLYTRLLEPFNGEKIFPDILILPLLAFDPYLSRLGMGGGFFDRTIEFLKNQKNSIITIGLAYDFQRSRAPLAIENTDQKLDFVVTEKTIFPAS
jgi:5-formyltetrahydrofolate cyclo-ligase